MQTQRQMVKHGGPYARVQITFPKSEGRTKQSFAEQCEINNIMARHQKTGALTHINQHQAQYGFATSNDFTESMRIVKTAQDMFNALPSNIRTRCGNDPGNFLEFVQDPENIEEMQKLGLIPEQQASEKPPEAKKTEPPTTATPAVAETPPEE